MKQNGKRFICFALITAVLFLLASVVLRWNNVKDMMHIKGFFLEEEDTIDVIAIGASEVYTSFNSPLMWEEYGFTSYSVSFAGAPGSLYKPMLEAALDRQSPKLLVVEVNGFIQNDEYLENPSKRHVWFDNMPWSKVKWKTMQEVIPKEELGEYVFDFVKYHDSWRHPIKVGKNFLYKLCLTAVGHSDTKCYGTTTKSRGDKPFEAYKPKFTEQGEQYLREFVAYCQEAGLEQVLFLRTPHCTEDQKPEVLDSIQKIVEEAGYDFLNLEDDFASMDLDPANDFYNKDHMNIYGMEKFSSYIGGWMKDHYSLPDAHPAQLTEDWNRCAEKMHRIAEQAKKDIKAGVTKDYYEFAGIYQF